MSVSDDGKGIPDEVLKRVGSRGFSFGKKGGNGLGLFSAKVFAEKAGGNITISSKLGLGTTVNLELPRRGAPAWFPRGLQISKSDTVIVLDDDRSIHNIWKTRFESLGLVLENILYFSSPGDLFACTKDRQLDLSSCILLIDYHLGIGHKTGLDIIETVGAGQAILVTGNFDEAHVIEKAQRQGVPILPKILIQYIPVNFASDFHDFETVLIDDDVWVRDAWEFAASTAGRSIRTFASFAQFFSTFQTLDKGVRIYIDVETGEEITGVEAARRLHAAGFSNLYLTTGHDPEKFQELDFVKDVLGKDPSVWLGIET